MQIMLGQNLANAAVTGVAAAAGLSSKYAMPAPRQTTFRHSDCTSLQTYATVCDALTWQIFEIFWVDTTYNAACQDRHIVRVWPKVMLRHTVSVTIVMLTFPPSRVPSALRSRAGQMLCLGVMPRVDPELCAGVQTLQQLWSSVSERTFLLQLQA